MVTSARGYLALLALVGLERLAELRVSSAHARRTLARGGVEVGRRHYAGMVALHSLFLPACAVEALLLRRPPPPGLGRAALAGAALAQALRWWAVASLGERWTTRIVVLPGAPPVRRGPYRWMKHPNYLAVVLEVACLPLVRGAWRTAAAFSLANAAVLAVRIPAEEAALGASWARAFAPRDRRSGP
ncbi:hypothetical protein L6R50_23845 [Myxococcota bacterium]|nr:hypothetical protein [Myxococcota bacterium]